MKQLETPVALIVFNRPEPTRRVFAAVAAARPSHLLLIADGPRTDRAGESDRCELVRKIVTAVDWPCKVETNFAAENLGCRRRVISGLNWVFSLVEEAIILEDDCLPDPTFFSFCSGLLDHYRDRNQVGMISGFSHLSTRFHFDYSYTFSIMVGIWGWATWRRAWKEYDEHLSSWPQVKADGFLTQLFPEKRSVAFWTRVFDAMYDGTGPDTWDYQWVYTCFTRNWLSIVPSRSLVQNIGFGVDATHTTGANPDLAHPAVSISFPLQHPPTIAANLSHAARLQRRFYTPSILSRIRRKLLSQLRPHANEQNERPE
jgi:hypothetical protein